VAGLVGAARHNKARIHHSSFQASASISFGVVVLVFSLQIYELGEKLKLKLPASLSAWDQQRAVLTWLALLPCLDFFNPPPTENI